MNFRASTGLGKAFCSAGDREWGAKMQDDLLDAVDWAVARGVATKDRVAIFGGSYGGYATLAALTFTPEAFVCGVDLFGPSNLNTLLATTPSYWASMLSMLHRRVGDPGTPEGQALLKARSPAFAADAIVRPLLIAQGANDARVKQAESDQIVEAMQAKGIPVTYLLFDDEGHGFARPDNNLAFFAATELFLARHLGGRAEPMPASRLNRHHAHWPRQGRSDPRGCRGWNARLSAGATGARGRRRWTAEARAAVDDCRSVPVYTAPCFSQTKPHAGCAAIADAKAPCFVVHGVLEPANGTPSLRIHKLGTRRLAGGGEGDGDPDLSLLRQAAARWKAVMTPDTPGDLNSVSGDFRVCPLATERAGWMQPVCIAGAAHLAVYRRAPRQAYQYDLPPTPEGEVESQLPPRPR